MSTATTVTLALDTTAGLEQFLEYLEEVLYAALEHEADARELALQDTSHSGSVDVLAEQFQTLYETMRTEIAAAVRRGGMTLEESAGLQTQYNQLTMLRDELAAQISTVAAEPSERQQASARDDEDISVSYSPLATRRKTLALETDDTAGSIPIRLKTSPAPVPVPPTTRPASLKKVSSHSRPQLNPKVSATKSSASSARPSPNPGMLPPDVNRTLANDPFLSYITNDALISAVKAHPQPRQLAHQIKAQIDNFEKQHTDRFAAWLGDTPIHTFRYIKDLSVGDLIALAAQPISQLRAVLEPERVRPESLIAWTKAVQDLQALYPVPAVKTVGEVTVSALAIQLLEQGRS